MLVKHKLVTSLTYFQLNLIFEFVSIQIEYQSLYFLFSLLNGFVSHCNSVGIKHSFKPKLISNTLFDTMAK